MTVKDILNNNEITISFEVFPPKTEDGFESVEAAAKEIAGLHPHFMSVTYGAGGGISKNTSNLAAHIQDRYNTPVIAHLTCVSSTKEFVRNVLDDYRSKGIRNVMALRGDIPKEGRFVFDYNHASELIYDIKSADPDICIGGACYPEGHIECERQSEDIMHLKEKVDAGCDFLTTQMFFDNNLFYNFLYKIREAGITCPIIPGIMPITNANQVARAIQLSGSFMPQRFKSLVDAFGGSPEAMCQAGIAYATDQIIDLYANGIRFVHVYSMNKPNVAKAILDNLSEILTR